MQKFSLENEVIKIKDFYESTISAIRSSVEKNMEFWIQLGKLLNEHQEHVESEGKDWICWSVENFPFLKERRRQQAMWIALIEVEKIRPYFFMGIDRLYTFWKNMYNYNDDPERNEILREFKIVFSDPTETDEEKNEFNKRVDKAGEYFKFRNKYVGHQYSKALLIDVIKADGIFSSADHDTISKMIAKGEKIDSFLLEKLVSGGSQPQTNLAGMDRESINSLLAKMIQTIDEYIQTNTIPDFLARDAVSQCYDCLAWLKEKIDE